MSNSRQPLHKRSGRRHLTRALGGFAAGSLNSPRPPHVSDLRRPSIDVLMMPSGPAAAPQGVAAVEFGGPRSPRDALRPVAEEGIPCAPAPQPPSPQARPAGPRCR